MADASTRVSFLLIPGFMMTAYVLAVDALRLANWRSGQRLFGWDVRTPDGRPAEANNGMVVAPDTALAGAPDPDAVFVCAGFSPENGFTRPVFAWLRQMERKRTILGGWDTGPLVLAEAGLMEKRRMALHWQAAPAVLGRYPNINISSERCEIDGRRMTGPGGLSTFDLIVAFIDQRAGANVARMVAHSANRDIQMAPAVRQDGGAIVQVPHLARAISLMEARLDQPIPIPVLAKRCGLSERNLNRLFRARMNVSARSFYLNLRLQRARDLIRQSDLPIAEIAAVTGFNSASRFAQAFRAFFGESARSLRKHPSWLQIGAGNARTRRLVRTEP